MKTKAKIILICCIITIIAGCYPDRLKLKPADTRPVQSIEIADADEAALLQQQLGIEIKHIQGNRLYYFTNGKEQDQKLIDIGYKINSENSMQVNYQIVKLSINNKAPEKNKAEELKKYGIEIINKEENYWVVRGSLEQLNRIQELNYKIELLDKEPRPREVEIIVTTYADIQKVNELGVDIYSSQETREQNIIIYGGAFDYQIETMQEMGYKVIRKN